MSVQEVIGILISLTALSSYINYKIIKLPKSIGLTLITIIFSIMAIVGGKMGFDIQDFAQNLLHSLEFNETFLHGMLGFLLFAGALHVNAMELAKQKALVALLATVSVVISTTIVAYATYGLTIILGIKIPLCYCFVFGALISPTDPIAVLGMLKASNAPKSLEMKIAGEALFNDGMGIVLFFVTLGIASGQQKSWTATEISLYFLQQGLGGILLGAIMGWFAARLIKNVDEYSVTIIFTLAIVTGGYTLANSMLNVSAPICMAVAGLMVGSSLRRGSMNEQTIQRLDEFWELLDEVLNAILFVLIGLECLRLTFNLDTTLAALGAIVIAIAARWISIAIPVACLARFRKFNHDVVMVMTWGGLRGGISIALALSIQSAYHDFIVTITYAVVLFSILVQGLTITPLVRRITASNKVKKPFRALRSVSIETKKY